jgi:hypothetical protein
MSGCVNVNDIHLFVLSKHVKTIKKENFVLSRFRVVNSPFFNYIKIHNLKGNIL